MSGARWGALTALLMVLIGISALAFTARQDSKPASKPRLALLTSLPIVLSEDFGLKNNGSAALSVLSAQFEVVPISTTSAEELAKEHLLLMAQPQAQTPANLVALDDWVRAGGRVLLLADPMLEWPSKRPLGDPLRPPPMFADTGLLAHWGLRLDAPDQRGLVVVGVDVYPMAYVSPGRLVSTSSNCSLSRADIEADCKIGKGRAVVVADADFLNPKLAQLRNPTIDNRAALLDLLDSLRQ